MIWTARPDGFRDFVNRRWLEYTGLRLEEALGKGFVAMHPEDGPQFLAQWKQAVQTGTPLEHEIRLRRADGEYCWFLDRIVPFRDESGDVLKWIATVTDMHELKRSEEALRHSEAHLAEAQRLSQTGSWAWSPATGDIRYWSEECYRVLGFDPHGLPPRFEEFFSEFTQTIRPRAGNGSRKLSATRRISNWTTESFIQTKVSGTFTSSAMRSSSDPAISVSS